jgi:hypothetical protein
VIGTINRGYFSKHNFLALIMNGRCVFVLYKLNFGTFFTSASGFKGLKEKNQLILSSLTHCLSLSPLSDEKMEVYEGVEVFLDYNCCQNTVQMRFHDKAFTKFI